MSIGSLFSGIGGLELGLEWAGLGPVLFQVERDPYAKRVLAKHWPRAQRFDDVCAVGAHNLPFVDVLCGGFPCQDLSYAGKGAGLAGARSGLWSEFARIIGELRPGYVVVENVAALLSRGLGAVLGDLAALGYDAWWDCIPASSVGAPHRRDRLFVVAVADAPLSQRERASITAEISRAGRHGALADSAGKRRKGAKRKSSSEPAECAGHYDQAIAKPSMGGGIDGLSAWMDRGFPGGPGQDQKAWEAPRIATAVPDRANRLRCLGNAVVPQVAYVIGSAIAGLRREGGGR